MLKNNLFTIKQIRFIVCGVALMVVALCLTGCAKEKTLDYRPAPPPSVLELRRAYLGELHADGVQVIKLGQTIRVVLLSDELFNPDSANMQENYRPVLRALSGLMQTYDKVNVKVAAYTDSLGRVKRQQGLTTRQAQVVASFLWSHGIDARLEYAEGYNRKNPVGWNGSKDGRFDNRRVEVSFRFYPESIPYA